MWADKVFTLAYNHILRFRNGKCIYYFICCLNLNIEKTKNKIVFFFFRKKGRGKNIGLGYLSKINSFLSSFFFCFFAFVWNLYVFIRLDCPLCFNPLSRQLFCNEGFHTCMLSLSKAFQGARSVCSKLFKISYEISSHLSYNLTRKVIN